MLQRVIQNWVENTCQTCLSSRVGCFASIRVRFRDDKPGVLASIYIYINIIWHNSTVSKKSVAPKSIRLEKLNDSITVTPHTLREPFELKGQSSDKWPLEPSSRLAMREVWNLLFYGRCLKIWDPPAFTLETFTSTIANKKKQRHNVPWKSPFWETLLFVWNTLVAFWWWLLPHQCHTTSAASGKFPLKRLGNLPGSEKNTDEPMMLWTTELLHLTGLGKSWSIG